MSREPEYTDTYVETPVLIDYLSLIMKPEPPSALWTAFEAIATNHARKMLKHEHWPLLYPKPELMLFRVSS